MKKRVFFFVPYPRQGPSVRLRVEQFLPYLEAEGIGYKVRSFLTPSFYDILYKEGNALRKFLLFLFCFSRRLIDVIHALSYDTIFIHREAFPIGPPVFEAILFLCGKSIVFDYDDAIYLPSQGSSRIISFLKCPWKTNFIVRHSKFVIAGNEYLKEHARNLNPSIKVIPTSIDTDKYKKGEGPVAKENIVIGWIGSHTTQIFLKELEGVFTMLTSRYKNLAIHLVGSSPDIIKNERIVIKSWSLDT
ncbi:MAG: hypothetical protein Q8N91_03975 [Candidatus Omnitrophota bacterium]|nr:hypothetical protein [Candidatus Omnitrophota bacterium]